MCVGLFFSFFFSFSFLDLDSIIVGRIKLWFERGEKSCGMMTCGMNNLEID